MINDYVLDFCFHWITFLYTIIFQITLRIFKGILFPLEIYVQMVHIPYFWGAIIIVESTPKT